MDAAWKYEQNKKKDYENRTKIDRMVLIYVSEYGQELLNMVIQGFTYTYGTIVSPANLTNKDFVKISGKRPNL